MSPSRWRGSQWSVVSGLWMAGSKTNRRSFDSVAAATSLKMTNHNLALVFSVPLCLRGEIAFPYIARTPIAALSLSVCPRANERPS